MPVGAPGKEVRTARAIAGLRNLFSADAVSMPVHWFYNTRDITRYFPPSGITKMEPCPATHPGAIMSLHSTRAGGRSGSSSAVGKSREIVGDVILKGRAHLWGKRGTHYHHGMAAGENTLNAHCARLLLRMFGSSRTEREYDLGEFLDRYVAFMEADPPQHGDTYAESYHRGFFANLYEGNLPRERCGAVTHDTASVGGLVTVGPLATVLLVRGDPAGSLDKVHAACKAHVAATHPDDTLAAVVRAYVELIAAQLRAPADPSPDAAAARLRADLETAARATFPILGCRASGLADLVAAGRHGDDNVVGGILSPACYITDSWPSLLYLAHKYADDPRAALIANANLGGDNVHRGAVLGTILGLGTSHHVPDLWDGLLDKSEIETEIRNALCDD